MTEPKLHWQQARIVSIKQLSPRIKSFTLAPAEPFAFRAGQHVDVRLTAPDGYQAERSYSIASAPGDHITFELAIERLEDGEVSPFFHDVAEAGDAIELRGPIGGHFVWSIEDGGPILLLGGGSGVVPLVSMLRHRAGEDDRSQMALLYSARTWDELIYRDELESLVGRGEGFHLAFTLTRDDSSRAGHYSRRIDRPMVSDLLAQLPGPPRQTFVCGSNRFVEAATQAAIAAGLAPTAIRTERYGG